MGYAAKRDARVSASDPVNHPPHYGGDTTYETIKVQAAKLSPEEFAGAMKFLVAKHLDRSGKKTADPLEDWRKAHFYLGYLIKYWIGLEPAGEEDRVGGGEEDEEEELLPPRQSASASARRRPMRAGREGA